MVKVKKPFLRFSLQVSLSTVFLALVLTSGLALGLVAYYDARQIIEQSVDEVVSKTSEAAAHQSGALFAPAQSNAAMLSAAQALGADTLDERLGGLGLMVKALEASDSITAVYTGNTEGDFLLVRRLPTDAAQLKRFNPPAETAYIAQSIERGEGAPTDGSFLYMSKNLDILSWNGRGDYVTYDPRLRPWYKAAMTGQGTIGTAPYVFFTTQEIGTTFAHRASDGSFVAGVDITLKTLSNAMAENRISPGTQSLLIGADGKVIAHPNPEKAVQVGIDADGNKTVTQASLADLDNPLIAQALERAKAGDETRQTASYKGQDWIVAAREIRVSGFDNFFLVLTMPETEILAGARDLVEHTGIIFVLIMFATVVAVLIFANFITKPLRDLQGKTEALRRFEFDNNVHVHTSISDIQELAHAIDMMEDTIRRFLDISSAIAAERDFEKLTERLLDEIIAATHTAGGVLYLTSDDNRRLVPNTIRSDKREPVMIGLPDIPVSGGGTVVVRSIADADALGAEVTPEELKALGLAGFAEQMETPPKFLLAAPLFNRVDELVGVLLLLETQQMDPALVRFTEALSGSAAISLETRQLIDARRTLFESLITLIASAIDAKSPYTGGHCARVPELTKMLAAAADKSTAPPFKDFKLDGDDWEAIHVAAWLHDCGKITIPDYVVDKATKLETIYDRIHEVRMRIEVMKREAEIRYLRSVIETGADPAKDEALKAELAALDEDYAFLAGCNVGGEFMSDEDIQRIREIAARTWTRTLDDRIGISHEEATRKARLPAEPLPVTEPLLADKPEHMFDRSEADRFAPDNPWGFKVDVPEKLYNRGELHNLVIRRGTLTEEDRFKINEHIIQTIKMLDELDFPKHLRNVPELAGGHHEKMDGTGYPKRLTKEDMSPVARMMAIADIFEALTAIDRPYKKGKTLSEALGIMKKMAAEQHIDPDLYNLFIDAGIYAQYAEKFMRPEQVDAFDPSEFRAGAGSEVRED